MSARIDVTEADLLAALAEVARPKPEPRPAGFFTIAELAAKSGRHPTTLRNQMRLLLAQGRAERREVRLVLEDGRTMPVMAYKLRAGQ